MLNNILAGSLDPGTITNPALGPSLKAATGEYGYSPVWFFQTFIPKLLTLGLIIGVLFFFFVMIIGAIQWISSGGDKNALETSKSKITNAVIGVVILFAVFAIMKFIENFFGISILTLDIGGLAI